MAESRTFSTPSIVHVRPSVTALRRTQRNNGAITICGQLDAPNRERGLVTYGMPQLHGLGNAENTPAGFGQGRPLDRLVCIISIHGVQYKRWQRFDMRFSKVVVGEHAIWGSSAWHGRNSNDLERNSLWITNGDGSSYHRSLYTGRGLALPEVRQTGISFRLGNRGWISLSPAFKAIRTNSSRTSTN